jgi:hypothetical protein
MEVAKMKNITFDKHQSDEMIEYLKYLFSILCRYAFRKRNLYPVITPFEEKSYRDLLSPYYNIFFENAKKKIECWEIGLAFYLNFGFGVEKNTKEAFAIFQRLANENSSSCQFHVGWCYENGEGVEKDLKQAVYW